MMTMIDRKRTLPDTRRNKTVGARAAAAALVVLMGAGLACSPPPEAPPASARTATPAPAPAPSPDGTAVASPGVPIVEGAPASPGAAAVPPPAERAPSPASEPAPPPPREPVMEWRAAHAKPKPETGELAELAEKDGKHVFTNADLRRYAKADDANATDAVVQAGKAQEAFEKDSLKKVQDQPATDAWKAKTKADAEDRVRAAEARLDALRRLSQSEANPLLPQPRLSAEAEKKREGLSAEQRYKMTQQEIQQAEQELADAKADLARVLKNFAPPR